MERMTRLIYHSRVQDAVAGRSNAMTRLMPPKPDPLDLTREDDDVSAAERAVRSAALGVLQEIRERKASPEELASHATAALVEAAGGNEGVRAASPPAPWPSCPKTGGCHGCAVCCPCV